MEKRFQIVTDSSCDLPQALADELDLAVLPLHVLIGEHTYANYLDGREIGFREFYDKLRDGERATTSAVNVSEFTAVMEEKLKAGLDILFIGFSSGLSTTYQPCALSTSRQSSSGSIILTCTCCTSHTAIIMPPGVPRSGFTRRAAYVP